jgi:hypothetical protein
MAILIINNADFSEKLKDFEITCKKCESKKVELNIDWASYPSCSWYNIDIICNDCKHSEEILINE